MTDFPMRILVPVKRIPDTDQTVRVDDTGKGIDNTGLPYVINPFDAVALEEAARISERLEEEVEIVTVGIGVAENEQTLRTSLAMGADRAVLIHCKDTLDSWNVAVILHDLVQSQSPQLVLMGKQAADDDANQTGQFLAAMLGWPQATFVSSIELLPDGLRVEREADLGIETLSLPMPAVVTCELRLNEPRYASLPAIMRAKRKPLDQVEIQELGVTVRPRVEILALKSVNASRKCHFVENASELITALRNTTDVWN